MRYFFAQDQSCHWYIVPEDKKQEWSEWLQYDEEDERSWDAPEFARMVDSGPYNYTFTDPQPRQ